MLGKLFKKIKTLLLFVAIVAAGWVLQQWVAKEEVILVNGKKAHVIDGDSFKVGNQEFRIYGIDAPEYRQSCTDKNGKDWRCGVAARRELTQILSRGAFSCEVRARDQFGRMVVTCADSVKVDLGGLLVDRGFAVSGYNFDEAIYGAQERNAEAAKSGIWQGPFAEPAIWREKNPRGRGKASTPK